MPKTTVKIMVVDFQIPLSRLFRIKVARMAMTVNPKLNSGLPVLKMRSRNTGASVMPISPRMVMMMRGVKIVWIFFSSPEMETRNSATPPTAMAV